MYLIDTNVFLEFLLGREHAKECLALLEKIQDGKMDALATHFSVHSICIYLTRGNRHGAAEKFLEFISGLEHLEIINLSIEDDLHALKISGGSKLGFDDAIQCHASSLMGCKAIITLDSDFAGAGIRALTPKQALEAI